MKAVLMVAAHKPYRMPDDPVYLPIHVGSAGKESIDSAWQRDDEGDNISLKNPSFCELTGHYWLWKHADADIYGLCHYRRYFTAANPFTSKWNRILSQRQIEHLLTDVDVVLPGKRHYFIETRETQYIRAHHKQDLVCVEQILSERCPEYLPAFRRVMKSRSGHIFNMFIMRKKHFDAYSTWLFSILFEAENRLDISGYADKRVYGYLAERLLDVWVDTNHLKIRECPVSNLEKQNWPRKICRFLKRHFSGAGKG